MNQPPFMSAAAEAEAIAAKLAVWRIAVRDNSRLSPRERIRLASLITNGEKMRLALLML